jgi:tetratricopeptide (TPR) repeat protein
MSNSTKEENAIHSVIPDTDPLYLGGSAGNNCAHLTDSTFGKLVRSRQFPPLPLVIFKSLNQVNNNTSRRAKTLLHCLSTGTNLSITWTFENHALSLKAYYTGDEFAMSDSFLETTFLAFQPVIISGAYSVCRPLEKAMNDESNAEILSHHLLHIFLRLQGSILDWETVALLCTHLSTQYAPLMKKKKWNYLLDLFTIRADVAFTHGFSGSRVGVSLTYVAEVLESKGRFEEAADIYQNVVDLYAPAMNEKAKQQGHCALAFKRAGCYTASEDAYVKALSLTSTRISLDYHDEESVTNMILSNLIMYYEWTRQDSALGEATET